MKDQSRDYTWQGFIWGAVLYGLFAVAPAMIILRYFLNVNVPPIAGLTALFICFVLEIKRFWALGERARRGVEKFFRFPKTK